MRVRRRTGQSQWGTKGRTIKMVSDLFIVLMVTFRTHEYPGL